MTFSQHKDPEARPPEVICKQIHFPISPNFRSSNRGFFVFGGLFRAHRNTDAFGGLFITANRWPQCSSRVLISLGRLGRDLERDRLLFSVATLQRAKIPLVRSISLLIVLIRRTFFSESNLGIVFLNSFCGYIMSTFIFIIEAKGT